MTGTDAEVILLRDQMSVIWGNPEFQRLLNRHSTRERVCALEVGGGVGILSGLVAALTGAEVVSTDYSSYDGTVTSANLQGILQRHAAQIGEVLYAAPADVDAASSRVRFETCSAEDLPHADETFDFVFSLNAFEHIGDPVVALAEIRRVLKPGGCAFIQFSPIFTADDGSHLYSQGLLAAPWCALLHTKEEIVEQVRASGKDAGRVDDILRSLNGFPPQYYRDLFANSGLEIQTLIEFSGYVLPGAGQSPEFEKAKALFSAVDLAVLGFKALLRK